MKEYSAFFKVPALLEKSPSDCLVSSPGHSLGGGSYLFAEMLSVYFTTPAYWAILCVELQRYLQVGL